MSSVKNGLTDAEIEILKIVDPFLLDSPKEAKAISFELNKRLKSEDFRFLAVMLLQLLRSDCAGCLTNISASGLSNSIARIAASRPTKTKENQHAISLCKRASVMLVLKWRRRKIEAAYKSTMQRNLKHAMARVR